LTEWVNAAETMKRAKKKVSFCKKKYKNGKRGKIGEIISIKNMYSALCFCQTPYWL